MASKTIVLITGANSGVGLATTEEFLKDSNNHVIMACRSLDKAKAAQKQLESKNLAGSTSLVQLDVTSESSIEAAAKSVTSDFGHVDILCNNAGQILQGDFSLDKLRKTFEINTFGPALMTHHFTPLLIASKASTPRLIYTTSDLGSITIRRDKSWAFYYQVRDSEYRMSKAALNMLAACNEEEFGRTKGAEKIKVYVFNPGYTVSNLSGTGEVGVEERKKTGALPVEGAATTLVDIANGKRDVDQEKGIINREGWGPW